MDDSLRSIVVVVALFLAIGAVLLLVVRRQAQARLAMLAGWAHAAEVLGLTYVPESGPWYARVSPCIAGQLGAATVRFDLYIRSSGKSSTTFTRVVATAPDTPHGFRLSLAEQGSGMFGKIASFLASQDIVVGHPQFDQAFLVKSNSPSLARTLLRRPMTDLLVDFVWAEFAIQDGVASAIALGTIGDPRTIVAYVRAAATLAEAPGRALARWNELAASVGGVVTDLNIWTKDGRLPPIELEPRGVPLRLEVTDVPDRLELSEVGAEEPNKKLRIAADLPEIEQAVETITASTSRPYRA